MSSGASPSARSGTPRAPSNYPTQQPNYNLQNYATLETLWAREKSRPAIRAEPCPVHGPSRRPEPYKQTLHNGSGAPPWPRAQLAPRPGTSGAPEPPRLSSTNKLYNNFTVDAITQNKTQPRNISQFSISQHHTFYHYAKLNHPDPLGAAHPPQGTKNSAVPGRPQLPRS